jgi:ABC-type sugar transport system permease subunit
VTSPREGVFRSLSRHPAMPYLIPAIIYLFVLTIYPFLYSVITSAVSS